MLSSQLSPFGRIAAGQGSAPVVRLVLVYPHVAEAGQSSPKKAVCRCAFGQSAGQVGLGKLLDGLKQLDQSWNLRYRQFGQSVDEQTPQMVQIGARVFEFFIGRVMA